MTPEEWRRVRSVFDQAVEQPRPGRADFVARACAGDTTVQRAVEALLHADEGAGGALDLTAGAVLERDEAPEALLGTRLGVYELLRVVGQGGMGVVYEAARADEQFRRRVAVKLIKRGLDSGVLVQRFRQEREILARLEHPAVARLLDAGTAPDGRPYLVMDYVEGLRIDLFCAAHLLPVPERVRLFREVCAAVAYAHRKLVVHRDLKPGNILVTPEGAPRLLDFGLAKLLDPAAAGEPTATGLLLMTPEYASPEQVRGEPVGTATDVYSLGVLLYELLAERRPYQITSPHPQAVLRAITDAPPARPSTVAKNPEHARALRGDLDEIVLMALRPEPERRYASAEQLSDDLERFQERRPVRARAGTLAYRARRWLRRHRVLAAALLLLAAWVATATAQARVARRERARAERRLADVRRLANTFLFDIHDAIVDVPGTTAARALVVRRAVEYLGLLAGEAQGDPGLQRELGLAYVRLGTVEGAAGGANLGDQKAALAHFETGTRLLGQAYAQRPEPALAGELADAHRRLGRSLSTQLHFPQARAHVDEARRLAAAAAASGAVEDVVRQASIEQLQADWHSDQSAWGEAASSLRAGLALLAALPAEAGGRADVRRVRLTLTIRLGDALGQLGRPDQSVALLDAFARDLQKGQGPAPALELRMQALLHGMAGSALLDLERPAEAAARLGQARAVLEHMRAADPANYQAAKDLTLVLALLCTAESGRGHVAAAHEACRSGLTLVEELARQHPGQTSVVDAGGLVCSHNGKLAVAEHRYSDALPFYRRVTGVAAGDDDGVALRQVAAGHSGMAEALAPLGKRKEAIAEARTAVALLERARTAAPAEPSVRHDLAQAQARLGHLLMGAAEREEGRALQAAALTTLEALRRDGMTVPELARTIARLRAP